MTLLRVGSGGTIGVSDWLLSKTTPPLGSIWESGVGPSSDLDLVLALSRASAKEGFGSSLSRSKIGEILFFPVGVTWETNSFFLLVPVGAGFLAGLVALFLLSIAVLFTFHILGRSL